MTTKKSSNKKNTFRLIKLALACCISIAGAGGCNLLGPIYGALIDPLIPPPTIKAEHIMSEKCLLVWIEEPADSSAAPQLKRELTEQLNRHLIEHKAIKSAVDYTAIVDFRLTHPDFSQMKVSQIGQTLGVDEILQMTITGFTLQYEAQAEFYQPHISGSLRIIDAASGERIWPAMLNEKTFDAVGTLTPGKGEHLEENLVRDLCDGLAQQLALYFYNHPGPKT
jgi:hypothetical protein